MKNKIIILISIFFLLVSCGKEEENKDVPPMEEAIAIKIIKETKKENATEIFLKYLKDFSGSLIALLGIGLAYPIVRKKLIGNHISNALNTIQETNREIGKQCQKLNDKYIPLTFSNNILSKTEIEKLFKDIKDLYYISQDGSSDVTTVLYFLKNTIQGTLKHYDLKNKKLSFISSREIYGLTIDTLDRAIFYSTQVVQIPKSAKIEQKNLINKKIQKFVSNSNFSKYKHFHQGVIFDPISSHFLTAYEKTMQANALIIRSLFRIFGNPDPVLKLLYLSEIYSPLILQRKNDSPILGGNFNLFLIKFITSNELTLKSGTVKKIVTLYYANIDDFGLFAENLKFEDFKKYYKDIYIKNSEFDINNVKSFSHTDFETVVVKFDYDYLHKMFDKNKSKMKDKMKENYAQ